MIIEWVELWVTVCEGGCDSVCGEGTGWGLIWGDGLVGGDVNEGSVGEVGCMWAVVVV